MELLFRYFGGFPIMVTSLEPDIYFYCTLSRENILVAFDTRSIASHQA